MRFHGALQSPCFDMANFSYKAFIKKYADSTHGCFALCKRLPKQVKRLPEF